MPCDLELTPQAWLCEQCQRIYATDDKINRHLLEQHSGRGLISRVHRGGDQ